MPYVPFSAHVPRLESVTIKLWLPTRANDWRATMHVTGESSLKRGSLWCHTETWPDPLEVTGYSVQDAVTHVALVALQDTPATQEMFDHCIGGRRSYEEPQLPF
jgi:hypothetical protein